MTWRLGATALLAVAFALRLVTLQEQSFDNDEILTMYATVEPTLGGLLGAEALSGHPPAYFLALRAWTAVVGLSEFAVRWLSVAFGMASLATLAAALRPLGQRVWLGALGLGALGPLAIYFAQEARSYAAAQLAVAAALVVVVRLVRRPESGRLYPWLGLAGAGCLYTSSWAALPLAGLGAMLALHHRLRRDVLVGGIGAALLAGVLFLPWAFVRPLVADTALAATPRADVFDALRLQVVGLSTGPPLQNAFGSWLALAIMVVLLALLALGNGLMPWRWFLPGSLAVSAAGVAGLAATGIEVNIRHIAPQMPVMVTLGAVALAGGWQRSPWLGIAGLILPLAMGAATARYFVDPFQQRPAFRAAASYVNARLLPGDVVLFNAPWSRGPFGWYLRGVEREAFAPERADPDREATIRQLRPLVTAPGRLWLLQWQNWVSDPQGFVASWIGDQVPRWTYQVYPYASVAGYYTGPLTVAGPPAHATQLEVRVGDAADLVATHLDPGALDRGLIAVTLYWRPLAPDWNRFTVFVQLLDSGNRVVAQKDLRPLAEFPLPPLGPGAIVPDRYDLEIPAAVPAGSYRVVAGLYEAASGRRLPVSGGGDLVVLGSVELPERARRLQ